MSLLDVSNLNMPYWLMNFEEHCEVLLTSTGTDRQIDSDILAKCLLQARHRSSSRSSATARQKQKRLPKSPRSCTTWATR